MVRMNRTVCIAGRSIHARVALFRVPSETSPKKDLDSFHQVLLKNYPMAQSQMGSDLWHLIFHDALAWLHQHIPNFCLGMLTGSIPITALPRDVLTRWNLRQKDVHWETRDAADDDASSPPLTTEHWKYS